jgi:hypothetical protein
VLCWHAVGLGHLQGMHDTQLVTIEAARQPIGNVLCKTLCLILSSAADAAAAANFNFEQRINSSSRICTAWLLKDCDSKGMRVSPTGTQQPLASCPGDLGSPWPPLKSWQCNTVLMAYQHEGYVVAHSYLPHLVTVAKLKLSHFEHPCRVALLPCQKSG